MSAATVSATTSVRLSGSACFKSSVKCQNDSSALGWCAVHRKNSPKYPRRSTRGRKNAATSAGSSSAFNLGISSLIVSNRNHQHAWDLQRIIYDDLFLKLRFAVPEHDLVRITSRVEDFGLLAWRGLQHRIVGLHRVAVAFAACNPDVRDQVPQIAA